MSVQNIKQDSWLWRQWYVIHTYSWYEDAVEKALRQRIETMNMQDVIFDVQVPKEVEFVLKKWKPHEIKKRIFPGYVLVNMIVTDESWFIVRNTPNVTWFIWAWNTPVSVSAEEFWVIQWRIQSKEWKFKTDFEAWDIVKITAWPFASYEWNVTWVDDLKWKIKVAIDVFDRETVIELDFNQVAKK